MDLLFESGLFSELGEVVGYDPDLYEDTQKQPNSHTSFPVDVYQDGMDGSIEALDDSFGGSLQPENGALDCLLAENNQLLDQLMTANGLELSQDDSVDLTDIDEVSAKLDYLQDNIEECGEHQDLLADLEQFAAPYDYPEAVSPSSSISTLPTEPSSPIDLLPFLQPEVEMQHQPPTADLTHLLQSLLDDNDNMPGVTTDLGNYYDECIGSPVSSEESYSTSATADSWNEDSFLTYSSQGVEESPGKSKSKKSKSTPYSKLPAGRKERKKKQNKEAAIRYREKKRKEVQEVMGEESGLAQRNNELKTEVLNLEREIMCMKELLSDVFNVHSL